MARNLDLGCTEPLARIVKLVFKLLMARIGPLGFKGGMARNNAMGFNPGMARVGFNRTLARTGLMGFS